ncbi:unnamed protein product [Rotaria sp. Silwood2]|nr:unnamed protein product [Rotaria sp. Silwood2]
MMKSPLWRYRLSIGAPFYSKLSFNDHSILQRFDIFQFRNVYFIFRQTTDDDDDDDAQQNVTYLSYFIDLSNVTGLDFALNILACPNVTKLVNDTRLLMLSRLIDNSLLISIFKQIKMIKSITEKFYFPSNFALKFVQHFPSQFYIELQVFSFDNYVPIINIFLTYLKKNLVNVKIYYSQNTIFDNTFLPDYIIEKRRQTFPDNIIDEKIVFVTNNGEAIGIYLM